MPPGDSETRGGIRQDRRPAVVTARSIVTGRSVYAPAP
jgi:hypothetical protein